MTLSETRKLSKHICRLLKVSEITWSLGRTPKGNLGVVFNANNEDFDIMLDSIPLSTKNHLEDENNIELKKMIEKYFFSAQDTVMFYGNSNIPAPTPVEKNKGGRPKGSKNKSDGKTTD